MSKYKMLLEITVLLILLIFVLITYQYVTHIINLRNFPNGPFPLPVIGNLHLLSKRPYEDLAQFSKLYGDVFSISFGMNRCVIVSSLEAAREGLVTKGYHFAGRPTNVYNIELLSRDYQDFAFADYSSRWKKMRKFTHSKLKVYGENLDKFEKWIVEESEELHRILLNANGRPLELEYEIGCSVLNIICRLTFGVRYERDNEEFRNLIKTQSLLVAGMGASEAVAFLPWLKIFPLEGITKLKKALSYRDPYFRKKLKEHQQNYDSQKIKGLADEIIKISQEESDLQKCFIKNDFIEMFLFDMFVAGNETILTTLRWFILYMLYWPEYQQKINEEIINAVGKEKYPSYKDRVKLPFLEACIHEAMRLGNTVVMGLPRKTTQDTSLQDKPILKDTQVIFNFWNLHMSDAYWQNPKNFNPYRWLDENDNHFEPGKYPSFLPFSAGIRNCPGEILAKLELFLFTSRLLHDFRMEREETEPLPSLDGLFGLTLTPKPFKVKFIPRDSWVSI